MWVNIELVRDQEKCRRNPNPNHRVSPLLRHFTATATSNATLETYIDCIRLLSDAGKRLISTLDVGHRKLTNSREDRVTK